MGGDGTIPGRPGSQQTRSTSDETTAYSTDPLAAGRRPCRKRRDAIATDEEQDPSEEILRCNHAPAFADGFLSAMLASPASGQRVATPAPARPRGGRQTLGRPSKPEDLDLLSLPFTRQTLHSAYGTFLLVSSDYGSGLELRDVHVDVLRPPVRERIAYRRTHSSVLTGKLAGDPLVIVRKSGKVAMSIPLNTANRKFDTSEHRQPVEIR